MPERQRGDRQIISKNGRTIEIIGNKESEHYPDKITLGVGGIEVMGKRKERSFTERNIVYDRKHQIENDMLSAVREEFHLRHPELTEPYIYNGSRWNALDQEFFALQKDYLEKHREITDEIAALEQKIKEVDAERYLFAEGTKRMDDVYAGKEGTLVYSRVPGKNIARELALAKERGEKILAGVREFPQEAAKYRVNFRALEHPPETTYLENLKKTLEEAGEVADIHQIEVLPAAQGKGIASALLDVANWDIAKTHGIKISIARVLERNPDGEKVIAMFEKDGFEKIYCPGSEGGMTDGIPNYYLLIKKHV